VAPDDPAAAASTTRWLFGDQLGPHFLDALDQPVLLIESRAVFARRRFHRAKAHLILSAMRHRAVELGEQCTYLQVGTYREGLDQVSAPLSVCQPTSRVTDRFVRTLAGERDLTVLEARGFATSRAEFASWAQGRGRRRLLMEDFYRDARRRLDVLMDGGEPAGGRWNFDHDNRQPPPRGARTLGMPEPFRPDEDEIDEQVRADLDRWQAEGDVRFVGDDGPRRFAATRGEAVAALEDFLAHRLSGFGPHEDAMLSADPWLAHSLLSAPMNLGLLDPLEAMHRAEQCFRDEEAPIASVEGYSRQLIGWRDYVWNLYWYLDEDYRDRNELTARALLPNWLANLDDSAPEAACLRGVLGHLRRNGWVHHIARLMVLGNWLLQHGIDPLAASAWFQRCFVDGYDWVMIPNVIGMSQHADGGVMATKPYAAGGAYINRMSDYCSGCRYKPSVRVGPDACPFTAGYWAFLHAHADRLAANNRMSRAVAGLSRLTDLDELLAQERDRGTAAP